METKEKVQQESMQCQVTNSNYDYTGTVKDGERSPALETPNSAEMSIYLRNVDKYNKANVEIRQVTGWYPWNWSVIDRVSIDARQAVTLDPRDYQGKQIYVYQQGSEKVTYHAYVDF